MRQDDSLCNALLSVVCIRNRLCIVSVRLAVLAAAQLREPSRAAKSLRVVPTRGRGHPCCGQRDKATRLAPAMVNMTHNPARPQMILVAPVPPLPPVRLRKTAALGSRLCESTGVTITILDTDGPSYHCSALTDHYAKNEKCGHGE